RIVPGIRRERTRVLLPPEALASQAGPQPVSSQPAGQASPAMLGAMANATLAAAASVASPVSPAGTAGPAASVSPAAGDTGSATESTDSAPRRAPSPPEPPVTDRPVVALAGGPTFSYSYPETTELLVAAGAEVVPFDPLRDEQLPEGTRALVFGGAFPELYADELSANEPLCRAVHELAISGGPIAAETTGLLWLVKEFDGRPMSGVLNARATTSNSVVVGYREAVARASSPLVRLGATVVGYKSHRTVVTPRCGDNAAWQWRNGQPEGFVWRKVHASYLNLH